jgi:hypothetical protein
LNIGPAYDRCWTVLDSPLTPTDQKVSRDTEQQREQQHHRTLTHEPSTDKPAVIRQPDGFGQPRPLLSPSLNPRVQPCLLRARRSGDRVAVRRGPSIRRIIVPTRRRLQKIENICQATKAIVGEVQAFGLHRRRSELQVYLKGLQFNNKRVDFKLV